MPPPFNERLKQLREASGLTQEALARAAGVSVSAVSKLEQRGIDPSWSTVLRLAHGITPRRQRKARRLRSALKTGESHWPARLGFVFHTTKPIGVFDSSTRTRPLCSFALLCGCCPRPSKAIWPRPWQRFVKLG